MDNLLEVRNLETHFNTRDGVVHAVNGVSFAVKEGETLGVVGESGSGKSVSMMSVLHLIPEPPGKVVNGEAFFKGRDLLKLSEPELRSIRGSDISLVFQDPMTSFNPVMTVGDQVAEPYIVHRKASKKEAREQALKYLEYVGISDPEDRIGNYPHEFSGGMRQRVMIAMGLICQPSLMIADEPTTALDVTIQAQIIELSKRLQRELGMSLIWITHDLGVIASIADRVNVMYGGYIVESASAKDLFLNPLHPYTIGLLGSLPRMDDDKNRRLTSIDGIPPILYQKPEFCPFVSRCFLAKEKCNHMNPPAQQRDKDDHLVACWIDPKSGHAYQ